MFIQTRSFVLFLKNPQVEKLRIVIWHFFWGKDQSEKLSEIKLPLPFKDRKVILFSMQFVFPTHMCGSNHGKADYVFDVYPMYTFGDGCKPYKRNPISDL